MYKIIIIEDDDIIRENLKDILEAFNYQAYAHSNGREAIQAVKRVLPDLVLCDIIMPDLSGYEVLQEFRREPLTRGIPFVFLSAKAEKIDIKKGLEEGADDYLVKPFTVSELIVAVNNGLEKRQ